ncbi:MAG: serine hydrolase [Gammaproteobacteria bacterium]|nr:serine hydrolase [Gammaproteobacteria bacterium]MBP6051692.1 serine hydrolase [Pseudomonadales bacterium]MBK6584701.1 serine hydrolase [Gammaproteobacteria bacterium]MBK7519790.1 serine hydrolase [Gammaproteobacteria bacterium]MBK7730964.1 serine hydrolase [Gammaproteobacteria bacterium]
MTFVGACLALLLVLLVWRLVSLQVLDTERGYRFLQGQGDARSLRVEPIPAYRGIISDRHGEPLAVSTPVQTLWANPKTLVAEVEDWKPLASALGFAPAELQRRIASVATREFVYLRRRMKPADAARVMALGVPGVYARREYQRFYPAAEMAAHVVGFTNVDDRGQEGIELAYDEWLAGVPGSKQVIKDLYGHVIRDVQEISAAHPGRALELSIDLRIQYLAYRELKRAIQDAGAESGTIVVLDARTSEVLAMANQPSYNPNNRDTVSGSALRNRAITDLFEPGSTVKPFTMMAALESGKYHPDTLIDTTPGYIRVGRKTFRDHHNLGLIPATTIITKSSQVGITKIALSLPQNDIHDVFERAGFGQTVGTGFPGESIGILPNYRKWSDVARANFAFGYGLSVTPLQLARAYAVLANRGQERRVTMLRAAESVAGRQLYRPELVEQLVTMMETVTQTGGTAVRAAIPGYTVAGKTGTVHRLGEHGYEANRYTSLFAGFAPALDPRVVCVVIVTDPRGGVYYGGAIAAPVFSAVVRGALRLLNVAPDNLPETRVADRNRARAPA